MPRLDRRAPRRRCATPETTHARAVARESLARDQVERVVLEARARVNAGKADPSNTPNRAILSAALLGKQYASARSGAIAKARFRSPRGGVSQWFSAQFPGSDLPTRSIAFLSPSPPDRTTLRRRPMRRAPTFTATRPPRTRVIKEADGPAGTTRQGLRRSAASRSGLCSPSGRPYSAIARCGVQGVGDRALAQIDPQQAERHH